MGILDWFKKAEPRPLAEQAEEAFQRHGTIPKDLRLDLIGVYGRVVEDMKGIWGSTASLPAPKGLLGAAILEELRLNLDLSQEMTESLERCYELLADFVPPDDFEVIRQADPSQRQLGVPANPTESKRILDTIQAESRQRRRELRKLFGRRTIKLGQIINAELQVSRLLIPSRLSFIRTHWPAQSAVPTEHDLMVCLTALDLGFISLASRLTRIGDGLSYAPDVLAFALLKQQDPAAVEDRQFGQIFDSFTEAAYSVLPDIDSVFHRAGALFARQFGLTAEQSDFTESAFVDDAVSRFTSRFEQFQEYKDSYVITD